ncbi:helix-turn-helix domain-containing protein [Cupriavidus sp. 2SB]|uniref:helix-turn-helix domain-containing protein n=1 Tax=Cupriavidus sp. 2SB TaxID=2502199 RepID=UPI0010F9AAD9|nr:helix-turn-helix domain-containing protein [Cupriavidus sp. 2SB]
MSVEAITWALKQKVGRSSTKHVLMLLANCTTAPLNRIYTSIAYLAESTEMDRKTIIAAIEKLQGLGFISDTGDRIGKTGQIPVYQLNMIDALEDDGEEKRNHSENGTVPKTDSNGTKNGGKQSQKRSETVPKTVHGTKGTKGTKGTQTRGKRASVCVQLPDWLPQGSWDDWLAHRKAMKAPFTQRAAELSISVLDRLRGEGHDPVAVINESVLRGWTGLFPLRQATTGGAPAQSGTAPSGTWWETSEGVRQMGAALGLTYDGQENARRYMFRVFKAAGPGAWVERELTAASRMNEFEYERVFAYFMGEKPVSQQQLAQRAAEQGGEA